MTARQRKTNAAHTLKPILPRCLKKNKKSCSLAGNRKEAHSWLGRQFSGRSPDSSSSDGEFGTVIAASAFAVTSLEEVDSLNQKKTPAETRRQTSLSKGKSRKEDNLVGPPDARKPSKRMSSK